MKCGIALGSNIGDRLAHLLTAREAIARLDTRMISHEDTKTRRRESDAPLFSKIYETEPVDCEPGTAPFLNAVMEIEYDSDILVLFRALLQIERDMGRPAEHERNAPRAIDLDLLYAGDITLQTPDLTLPHPRIAERRFVLQPLADIHPDLILLGMQRTVAELLAGVPAHPGVTLFQAK
jgi:2-amino-4-hydroxy-6-hydroxymethyldihydropteridine diphosphokinase